MSRSRSACTLHVKIRRNSDSQRDFRDACRFFGNSETSAYGKLSMANRGELKGTAKAHAATRRMKEYQDTAAEKGTTRTKADQEEERQQREHG